MPPRDAKIRHMLQELETLGRGLTKWEEEFLAEMADQFDRTGKLTNGQLEKLEQIYEDRVR